MCLSVDADKYVKRALGERLRGTGGKIGKLGRSCGNQEVVGVCESNQFQLAVQLSDVFNKIIIYHLVIYYLSQA